MVVVVEYPIIVHVDNVGDILLSYATWLFQQTNHIGVSHHFIWISVEYGIVKLKFWFEIKSCRPVYQKPK